MSDETTWRPMRRSDVDGWAELLAAIREADGGSEHYTTEELLEEFDDPYWDLESGSVAVVLGDRLIGYGAVAVRPFADQLHDMRYMGGVHPEFRRRRIGGQLVSWAEDAAIALHHVRFPDRTLSLSTSCAVTDAGALGLHEKRGYERRRWFNHMTRDLSTGLPGIPDAADLEVAGWTPARSGDALLVRNEAFRDHWGSTEWTTEGWEHLISSSAFRGAFSFLAYSETEPIGVVVCQEYERDPAAKGRDLYVWIVGTRREYRKQGIASVLLARVLAKGADAGFVTASLDVDAGSPTGAIGLYEGLGFQVEHSSVIMTKFLS